MQLKGGEGGGGVGVASGVPARLGAGWRVWLIVAGQQGFMLAEVEAVHISIENLLRALQCHAQAC